MKTKILDLELLNKQKEIIKNCNPKFVIGVDAYDKGNNAYCLVRKYKNSTEFILCKNIKDNNEFWEEVYNVAKYFNAAILKE